MTEPKPNDFEGYDPSDEFFKSINDSAGNGTDKIFDIESVRILFATLITSRYTNNDGSFKNINNAVDYSMKHMWKLCVDNMLEKGMTQEGDYDPDNPHPMFKDAFNAGADRGMLELMLANYKLTITHKKNILN